MMAHGEASDEQASEKEGRSLKHGKSSKSTPDRKQSPPKAQDLQPSAPSSMELESMRERLRKEEEKSKEYLNKLLYAQADFENYRKRLNQEVDSRIEAGKAGLIQDLLAIADELELGLNAARDVENAGAVSAGLEMVLKKLRDLLAAEGLTPIESMGRKFDPAVHEAVQRVETADAEEGTVLEEVRRGFTLKGKLIRPSIVKIAVHEEEKESEQSELN